MKYYIDYVLKDCENSAEFAMSAKVVRGTAADIAAVLKKNPVLYEIYNSAGQTLARGKGEKAELYRNIFIPAEIKKAL